MRIFTIIFCLFLSISALAQNTNASDNKNDTTKICICDTGTTPKPPLVIVDGEVYNNDFSKINPNEILRINILKDSTSIGPFEGRAANGVIVVTTKIFAIRSYQKRLSAFSKIYKSYLESHANNDSRFLYILNGEAIQGKIDDITNKLYDISNDKIEFVSFNVGGMKEEGMISKPVVIITTK